MLASEIVIVAMVAGVAVAMIERFTDVAVAPVRMVEADSQAGPQKRIIWIQIWAPVPFGSLDLPLHDPRIACHGVVYTLR